MDSDEGVAEWLTMVARYGFCIATGTPATLDATHELVARVSYVRETIFGGFWDFEADLSKADTAYTNLELRPHTDGTYSHDAPGMQVLHCISFDGTGGESSIVDGFWIAAELERDAPEHFHTLSTRRRTRPVHRRRLASDGRPADPASRPQRSSSSRCSFNNSDRAPFLLPPDEMMAFYDALRAFETLANDHANAVASRAAARRSPVVRQLAGAARPSGLHRPPASVWRLPQPRGLREPPPPGHLKRSLSSPGGPPQPNPMGPKQTTSLQ